MARTSPDPNLTGYPPGIKYIIGNEGCERFSYYGMRAILYVYIVGLYINLRGMDGEQAKMEATAAYHLFGAAVYALPLIGAMLADRLLGKYYTILSLSVVYCLGHLVLALTETPDNILSVDPIMGMYIGLGLIAVGSGGIKPCVSAHVGDQFGKSNWHLLQKIYNAFYFIINFGSAFATLIIPAIRGKEISPGVYEGSVSWAFGVPGILMGLATIAFWMGRHSFVHVPATHPGKKGLLDVLAGTALFMVVGFPIFFLKLTSEWLGLTNKAGETVVQWGGMSSVVLLAIMVGAGFLVLFTILFNIRQRIEPDDGFLALTFLAIKAKITRKDVGPGTAPTDPNVDDLRNHWLYGPVARTHGSRVAEGPMAVWKIISVFIFICVFWALFDQHSSTWIEQAKAMDRVIDLSMGGFVLLGALMGLLMGFIVVISVKSEVVAKWSLIITGFVVGATAGIVIAGFVDMATNVFGTSTEGSSVSLSIALIVGAGVAGAGVFAALAKVTTSKWLTFAVLIAVGCVYGYLMGLTGPHELQPSQVPALNPFMVMVLIPLTTFGLYPLLDKLGWTTHPLRRMTLGMMAAGFSFVIVALIQQQLDDGESMHIAWQILPYLVLTLAEVMVSITGLEFAYTQAPKRMKSVIMGFWLFNVSLGNLLVALIAQMPDMPAEKFFWVFAGLMFGAGTLFGLRGKFYRYKDYSQDVEKPSEQAEVPA